MTVPYTFGTATTSIPLSNLDSNFNTPITLGNTSIYLGNTTTTIGNLTLTNVTISSGTANITSNITYATANAVVFTNASSIGTTSSALTFDGTTITSTKFAGALNGTVGATTASSGAFTTGTFSGAVTLGAISSFGTSLLHTIGGHSFVQGDANATYLYGGSGIGIQLRNSANSATLVTFADSLTTYTSPVTFNAAITLGAVSSFGTSLTHTIGGHLFVQGDATTTYLYGGTGGISFRNATNTSELALITNAGLVGIGTSSPAAKLEINDNGSGQLFTNAASGNFNIGLLGGVGDASAYIYQRANAPMLFATNNAERMRIDSSGNVGIGTNNPSSYGKLAVDGTIINASAANTTPFTQQRISVYNDGSNWGYLGYGNDAIMRIVYSSTASSYSLLFGTTSATNNTGTFTETLRISNTGALVLKGGTSAPTGVGVTFPATQVASPDANTLDDYEEGSWTPEINTNTPPTTPFGQYNDGATYTKIGNVVYIKGMFRTNGVTIAGASGFLYIGGLPFAPSSSLVGGVTCVQAQDFATNAPRFGYPSTASRMILKYTPTATGNTADCDETSLTTGSGLNNLIQIFGFYTV